MIHINMNTSPALTKLYVMFTDSDPLPGGTQAFSSYPGSIFSGDDFYILSSGLVRAVCTSHEKTGSYLLGTMSARYTM